jgi:hypothetical protein
MYMSETVFFYGETDGKTATGVFPLDSDILYSTVDFIRPDKGMKCEVYVVKVSGAPVTVFLEQTEDVTVSPSPSYKAVGSWYLASAGELHEDERRPIVLRSRDGKQAFRFAWSQTTPNKSYILVKVEFSYE